ncbi:MAG: hypothetical protein ACE5DM_05185 [Candidatus Nanoarchaeia archaeon]
MKVRVWPPHYASLIDRSTNCCYGAEDSDHVDAEPDSFGFFSLSVHDTPLCPQNTNPFKKLATGSAATERFTIPSAGLIDILFTSRYRGLNDLAEAVGIAKDIKYEDHIAPINKLMTLKVQTCRPIRAPDNLRKQRHNINHYPLRALLIERNSP